MGTNYYWGDGQHIAKTSAVGDGKFKVFWAIDPMEVHHNVPDALVIDEYGHEMRLADFWEKAIEAVEHDISTVGEEFS